MPKKYSLGHWRSRAKSTKVGSFSQIHRNSFSLFNDTSRLDKTRATVFRVTKKNVSCKQLFYSFIVIHIHQISLFSQNKTEKNNAIVETNK